MPRRAYLWLAGVALVVGALLTDRLLWEPGLTEDKCVGSGRGGGKRAVSPWTK
jgi:hypothetical protein